MPQSLVKICVHIAFSTKERQTFLADEGIRRRMHAYLATVCASHESHAIMVGGAADHVHLLCSLSKTETLADLVKEVKRTSSIWVKTVRPDLAAFQWQAGYGAFSVSHSNVARVREYIANQEEHHRKRDFKNEFRELLRRHGIEFDERYVWN